MAKLTAMEKDNKQILALVVLMIIVFCAMFGLCRFGLWMAERFGMTAGLLAMMLPILAADIGIIVMIWKDNRGEE